MIAVIASMTKPITRSVQGNPIFGRSCCTIAGNTMPPDALPEAAMPIASDRLVLKYVEIKANALGNC